MKRLLLILLAWTVLFPFGAVKGQTYANDFDNRYTWYPPWFNLNIVADSLSAEENYVCLCDSTHEFGLGFSIEAGKAYPCHNINCKYEFLFKTNTEATQASVVFSIDSENGNRYWQAYPLANYQAETGEWSLVQLDLNFPADYLNGSELKSSFGTKVRKGCFLITHDWK